MISKTKNHMYTFFVYLLILPFVPTSFQIFNDSVFNVIVILKTFAIALVCIRRLITHRIILNNTYIKAIFFSLVIVAVPTMLNDGSFSKYVGFVYDSLGIALIIDELVYINKNKFFKTLCWLSRIVIYSNFIVLLIYPNGIYQSNNIYMFVRYGLIDMDNQAVAILIPFMFILFSNWDMREGKFRFVLRGVDITVCISTLLLFWCATALIAVVIALLVFTYSCFTKKKITLKKLLVGIGIACLLVVFFQIQNIFDFFIVDVLDKDVTLSGRTFIWESAIDTWLDKPLIGQGLQESEGLVYWDRTKDYRHAHNQFLQILIHGGIIYFVSFIFILKQIQVKLDLILNKQRVYTYVIGIFTYLFMCITEVYGHMVGLYILMSVAYCYADNLEKNFLKRSFL